MLLPIYAYGQPVLKRVAKDIEPDYADLELLITNMWETMYHASGVGLAAPQIGRSIRLFLVDTVQMMENDEKDKGIKQVFINAQIVEELGEAWEYEEGCLSIPHIRGDVERQEKLVLSYLNEQFEPQTTTFEGINARVIQHEYDHIDGILFTDHLKPIRKRLIRKKLDNIRKGNVDADYKMKFHKK